MPWTPLTWTFARGASGSAGSLWHDGLAYLDQTTRAAAGATPSGTPFDRLVRIVFEVAPQAEFDQCVQTPLKARSFRSEALATGTGPGATATSRAMGWVVGVDLAQVEKTPDGGVAADGSTATYGIDVTITDPTRLDVVPVTVSGPSNTVPFVPVGGPGDCVNPRPLQPPTRTPWFGLGDLERNGVDLQATFASKTEGEGFRSRLVVTDTFVDDGRYQAGSATVDMADPWGRPFDGHLASEEVERVTVDGRQASRVTWAFDYYPSPANMARAVGAFPCATERGSSYVTAPSSMRIEVPLEIPDDTPDGTTYPNEADVRIDHFVGDGPVRSQGEGDEALVTVRNPQPPPPTTKVAVPDEVAPGDTFDWVVEAELRAG